jgi:thioesterase domain-containing protein
MGVEVQDLVPSVVLVAPLAPNVNHRGSAFGGSIAALATLAAWSAVRLEIEEHHLVIAREEVDFLKPGVGPLRAHCDRLDGDVRSSLKERLSAKGRARVDLEATVSVDEVPIARFRGRFVALCPGADAGAKVRAGRVGSDAS